MTLVAIISDEKKDLDNEVVRQSGIKYDKYLRKGGLFLRNHDAESLPIGRVKTLCRDQDNQTVAEIKFSQHNPDAKIYYNMVKDKEINSFSIGYTTLDTEIVDGVKHLTEIELHEISLVNIGANETAGVKAPIQPKLPTCICCKSDIEYPVCSKECSETLKTAIKEKLKHEISQFI